jgi:hypothetical protein
VDDALFAKKLISSTILTLLTNYGIRHPNCGDECNLDKVRTLLHSNVSNENFPKENFMIKIPIWWGLN